MEKTQQCRWHKRDGSKAPKSARVGKTARDELKRLGIKRIVRTWTTVADATAALTKARGSAGKRSGSKRSSGTADAVASAEAPDKPATSKRKRRAANADATVERTDANGTAQADADTDVKRKRKRGKRAA